MKLCTVAARFLPFKYISTYPKRLDGREVFISSHGRNPALSVHTHVMLDQLTCPFKPEIHEKTHNWILYHMKLDQLMPFQAWNTPESNTYNWILYGTSLHSSQILCGTNNVVMIHNNSYEITINGFQVRKINEIRNVIFGLLYGKPFSALRPKLGCSPSWVLDDIQRIFGTTLLK